MGGTYSLWGGARAPSRGYATGRKEVLRYSREISWGVVKTIVFTRKNHVDKLKTFPRDTVVHTNFHIFFKS